MIIVHFDILITFLNLICIIELFKLQIHQLMYPFYQSIQNKTH